MTTTTEISSTTDSISGRDILYKAPSLLDDNNKDAPHTITDQTPTRFLARCSKLDLEPNPFEQSFSHITPLGDTSGTNSPKPSLPPVAEITSPAAGGTSTSERYGWNLQSLRTGPLSPAMLEGPQSFDGLGVATNTRTGTTPLGFQSFADQSPRSAALFGAQSMALTSTFNNSSNTVKPGNGLMAGQFGPKAVSNVSGASVVDTQNGPEMNDESATDVVPTKTEREDYGSNTLTNSTTTLSTRSRSTKSKTNGVRPPSPTDHNTTSSEEESDDGHSNDLYTSSPKNSKTSHRRKASDDLMDQPAQKKSNQKTKNDLSDAEKRKNFLERNRQGMIIITSICHAALKCRQRKKQWLANLQAKVEYLTNENEQLQSQATSLREEILNLKTLLLAHKDCPIAQANGVLGIEALAHSQAGMTALHGVPIGMNMGMMQNTIQNVHGVQQPVNVSSHIQVQPHISNHVNGGPGYMRM
ncbi:5633_t:CDS:2 [Paraglomus brasilianum]|uniref:5633_t:CDS:1 n=1 Tax=Paraglomus brasilianum TaxID=144538 RepID=A0A9N8W5L3_9GLOM|nr:5633_t:CDS:2 [Paraglomus brasilianum]